MITAIRLKNYKCFEDSGWIDINSLNLLFGYNSSGKSSILKFFILLKQTLSNSGNGSLVFFDDNGVDLGNYKDVVFAGNVERNIEFILKINLLSTPLSGYFAGVKNGQNQIIQLRLSFGFDNNLKIVVQNCYEVLFQDEFIFSYSRNNNSNNEPFIFKFNKKMLNDINVSTDDFFMYANKFILSPIINNQSKSNNAPLTTKEILNNITTLSININNALSLYFSQLVHIGPLRIPPKRLDRFSSDNPQNVGSSGQFAYNILYNSNQGKNQQNNLLNKVNKWLYSYNYKLILDEIGQAIVEFKLLDTRSHNIVSIVDAGFGISQVLPIVVELMSGSATNFKVVLIEQPEIHLHTKMQAELADLLIECIKTNPNNILIVETHSENLLLRIRKNLLKNKLNTEDGIGNKNLSISYVSNNGTNSRISKVNFLDNGNVEPENSEFNNFFNDSFSEFMEISQLANELKNKKAKN